MIRLGLAPRAPPPNALQLNVIPGLLFLPLLVFLPLVSHLLVFLPPVVLFLAVLRLVFLRFVALTPVFPLCLPLQLVPSTIRVPRFLSAHPKFLL